MRWRAFWAWALVGALLCLGVLAILSIGLLLLAAAALFVGAPLSFARLRRLAAGL